MAVPGPRLLRSSLGAPARCSMSARVRRRTVASLASTRLGAGDLAARGMDQRHRGELVNGVQGWRHQVPAVRPQSTEVRIPLGLVTGPPKAIAKAGRCQREKKPGRKWPPRRPFR